jgi:hypothetical protein
MAKVPPYNTEFEEHPAEYRNMLSVIKRIVVIAAVTFTTAHLAYASPQHSGAECYHNGHRLYVPDGLKYPRQAWANWGISCRTQELEIPAGLSATAADGGERPEQWCGWWMRQHLGGHYGPEFNVARNWLKVGRPLDGPRPGAIGVKAHHVFQVVQVIDTGHVLAVSGNDYNAVRTRIRTTSDVIGWRDVTEERPVANEAAAAQAAAALSIAVLSAATLSAPSSAITLSAAALSAAVFSSGSDKSAANMPEAAKIADKTAAKPEALKP